MPSQFVHLRLHSEYSMLDGMVRIKPLIQTLCEKHMPAVALTDQGNLFAAVKFYSNATQAGIKPILGADILLFDEQTQQNFKLALLCINEKGYRNLTKLISKGYTDGQHNGIPTVQWQWLQEYNQGLILLSGGLSGDIAHHLLNEKIQLAENQLLKYKSIFNDRFYLELQRTNRHHEEKYNQLALDLSSKSDVPVVATNDVRFLEQKDYLAHEARVCIHDGDVLDDPKRKKKYSEAQYLKTPEEMIALFSDIPEAIVNSVEIAKRCNVYLQLGKNYLPNFPIPQGSTVERHLEYCAQQGLSKRLTQLYDSDEEIQNHQHQYEQRLKVELDVINNMGFPGYFLIVADFIQWAKDHGVPVGPGRGSGAGSLVAYALGITDLDPLEYELLFERFLNPERVSMPDFDVDFCMEGRDRVIEYVAHKYGRESVSQIITFGSMAAKAVVRDVGRVLGHPYGFVDKIAKLIPFEIGITLKKALEQEEELNSRYQNETEVQELIDLAQKLEGLTRNAGKHAGGVVIAPSLLTDFTPLYCESGSQNLVSQFDKDDVESVGLVKFDFLGLRTLTIINWAVQSINQKKKTQDQSAIDISIIPTDDTKAFELLKSCQTTAVFQLESRGMKDLIKRLQPDCFEDIIALVALFRPGPLQSGMVDDFIDRKHGRAKVSYPHPDLAPILQPTYGVILYQEQVMQIAQVLAGYTLGGADLLRRAMGKKKPEEMAKQRQIFTTGAVERGVAEETATYIFDLMEKFAGYGFNKSHSAAYALVAYQTAWLKAHYPAEFMAAVLSSDMDNTDKVVTFIEECRSLKIEVLPPCINHSYYHFTVNEKGQILYGLGAIKGVGESAIDSILDSRKEKQAFNSLFELCERVDTRKVNRRVLEALIRSGALDAWNQNRSSLFLSIDKAIKIAEKHNLDNEIGQHDLFFDGASDLNNENAYIESKPWSDFTRLSGEKETLGMYLTGHPIDSYRQQSLSFCSKNIVSLNPSIKNNVTVLGLAINIRKLMTKKGKRLIIITLDDGSGRIDVTVFSELYETHQSLLQKDQILVIQGKIDNDQFTGGIRMNAEQIYSFSDARAHYAKRISITVALDESFAIFREKFQELLNTCERGTCQIYLNLQTEKSTAQIRLPTQWSVHLSQDSIDKIYTFFDKRAVSIYY